MKQTVAFALAFVLVLVIAVAGETAEAACVATNCAIDEQKAITLPPATECSSTTCANAREELGNITVRALRNQASATSRALSNKASATSRVLNSATPEPTESAPPASPCTGSNC
jgi:hypothetical protein